MYPKGLKTSIILLLLFILAAAMLLVDFVMIGAARREMLGSRLEMGNSLIAFAQPILAGNSSGSAFSAARLSAILGEASANCLVVLNSEGEHVLAVGPDCESGAHLGRIASQALVSGTATSAFAGMTKGIFLPDRKNLLVARPVLAGPKKVGAIAVALDLGGIYQSLRNSQRIFTGYFLVNLLVFTVLGFLQLYRRLLKPIHRLVNTAEEFHDDGEFAFLPETKDGEFNQLSHTLNKMLTRINRDRARLQETIADLEDANLRLRKTQREMVRTEKLASVGRLSAGIAHEIGNPIGIVIGYLELLRHNQISDEQRNDFLARAEIEANRVNIIIRQLLDFARQPADEQQGQISVHEIINEVAAICTVQPMMAGISLVIDAAADDDMVAGNSGQLKQIFLNLLINAADAIQGEKNKRQDGRILIRTINPPAGNPGKPADFLQIQFVDNGPGIAAGDLENIFDPFYTTKEPGRGTGLGLSICFTIIANMRGSIKAASEGSGTTITVVLPLLAESGLIPG
jgi:signal transduction histidine kinase